MGKCHLVSIALTLLELKIAHVQRRKHAHRCTVGIHRAACPVGALKAVSFLKAVSRLGGGREQVTLASPKQYPLPPRLVACGCRQLPADPTQPSTLPKNGLGLHYDFSDWIFSQLGARATPFVPMTMAEEERYSDEPILSPMTTFLSGEQKMG